MYNTENEIIEYHGPANLEKKLTDILTNFGIKKDNMEVYQIWIRDMKYTGVEIHFEDNISLKKIEKALSNLGFYKRR